VNCYDCGDADGLEMPGLEAEVEVEALVDWGKTVVEKGKADLTVERQEAAEAVLERMQFQPV
jgi:uncharacterized protein YbbK (DUF523 family)